MQGTARTAPVVRGAVVDGAVGQPGAAIRVESAEWFAWLETVSSFSYVGAAGRFTARKERRERGGWYWKAYRTADGAPRRAYLGKSGDLTAARLEDIARRLAERAPAPEAAWTPASEPGLPRHRYTEPGEAARQVHAAPRASADAARDLMYPARVAARPRAATLAEPAVTTKLALTPARARLVRRERLTATLERMADGRLIVISAPPGSGKTTLLSQWIGQTRQRIAFIALDPADSDPVRFCRYLCEAVERACPGAAAHALALLRAPQLPSISPVLARLVNGLAALEEPVALVIDDYHHITDDTIHEALAFLAERGPAGLHIVLSTRSDPPLPLARLRVRHQLYELRAEELAFQTGEAQSFLRDTMGLRVSDDDAGALTACTEGWVGGLQLAALSLQGRPDVPATLSALTSGGHRALAEYLMEEVVGRQPNDVQRFVLETCLLDRLSAPLCAEVTGLDAATAQDLLDRLERGNLFLVPLDAERRWYRYHHLFAEFLRDRLRRAEPDTLPRLHLSASEWHERGGDHAEAIAHALAAGAFERAGLLIQRVGASLVHASEVGTLLTWLGALPADLVGASPRLCLLHAWAEITRGQLESADAWLRRVERLLSASGEPRDANAAAGPSDAALRGEVAALRAHVAAFWGDNTATVTFALRALDELPSEALFLRALTALNLGIARWLQGEVLSASPALTRAYAAAREADSPYIALLALCGRAQVEIVLGQRQAALRTARRACQLAAREGRSLAAAAYAYVGMGQMLYELNDLDAAARYLRHGIALGHEWKTSDMLVYGYTVLAQVRQAQRDEVGALEMIRKAERCVRGYQQRPWIVTIMIGQQVRLAIAQGRIGATSGASSEGQSAYVGDFDRVTLIRLHLATGETDQALELVAALLPAAEAQGRGGTITELRLLAALAHAQRGEHDTALAVLADALARAAPEGYVRLFADEGEPMAALLAAYLAHAEAEQDARGGAGQHTVTAYARTLLAALGRADTTAGQEPASGGEALAPGEANALSARELEIVRGLAEGLSNTELARDLTLEVSTVKWHLSRIYAKLNVQSRTQAIRQARELALV